MAELHVEATVTLSDAEEQMLKDFGDEQELVGAVLDVARSRCKTSPGKECALDVCVDDNSSYAVNNELRAFCRSETGCHDPKNVAFAGMEIVTRLNAALSDSKTAIDHALTSTRN